VIVTTWDLETTYLGLDGRGKVTAMPGGATFWQTIDQNPAAGGTLVSLMGGEGDWASWEMHPEGDEVLVLLEGAATVVFERPDRDELHPMRPGSTLVIPAGAWHRAVRQSGAKMLFITYGPGTTHRPVTEADRSRLPAETA
jgi:mannose-6-phosphate isomerase-like protein (cupin superfamily)